VSQSEAGGFVLHHPPEPIPLRDLAPWTLVACAFVLLLWVTGFDQGTISQSGTVLHEVMHDGRHSLGLPCH
jgi:Probable cobalt transporter subunit (CbtB)